LCVKRVRWFLGHDDVSVPSLLCLRAPFTTRTQSLRILTCLHCPSFARRFLCPNVVTSSTISHSAFSCSKARYAAFHRNIKLNWSHSGTPRSDIHTHSDCRGLQTSARLQTFQSRKTAPRPQYSTTLFHAFVHENPVISVSVHFVDLVGNDLLRVFLEHTIQDETNLFLPTIVSHNK
jgi:hypothetical protein